MDQLVPIHFARPLGSGMPDDKPSDGNPLPGGHGE